MGLVATRQMSGTSRKVPLVASLSELSVRVQRERTIDSVLTTAGQGALGLGMRLCAFQLDGRDLVLRYVATSPSRLEAIERQVGRPLEGLRAPLAGWQVVDEVVRGRRTVYREDLDVFDRFLRQAAQFDSAPLDAVPETAGITNGVLAPLYVREQPWGLVSVVSPTLTRQDSHSVALFATHVGSALEVAESLKQLERANAELARAQRELVHRERLAALGELAAMVAHEVRNPLGVLFNSIGSLRRMVDSGSVQAAAAGELLDIASEEADRLNRIVSDLLDFAHPNEPDLRPSSVGRLVHELVASVTTRWAGHTNLRIAHDLPAVEMDARLLRQALLNVVQNGLQAMGDGGVLDVTVTEQARGDRRGVRIDLTDTGPGVPRALLDKVFQPFFTTKASGTGLGLAIVRRIVEAHRGEVAVESDTGRTSFTLWIPISHHA